MWRRWALILGMMSILFGCGRSASSVPSIIPERAPLHTPTTIPAMVEAQPSSAPAIDPCPARRDVAFPERPENFDDYAEVLRTYLAEGGDSKRIPALLAQWEAKVTTGETLVRADLDGNGIADSIVAFVNPASQAPEAELHPPEGVLAIYTCREGTVRSLYTYAPGAWFGLNLVGAEDVTQDELVDLVYTEIACGAQTCWHTLHVWSWGGRDFQERVGDTFTFIDATFALQDGQILAGIGGASSVDAGPQRSVTTTLAWGSDPTPVGAFTVTATVAGPAIYRYHVFRDGDEALFAGRYAYALDAYLRMYNDKTLKAWAVHISRDEEEQWFTALTDWRLLLLELRLENEPNAQTYYERLMDDFPPGTVGYAVVAMAQRFWGSHTVHRDMALACAEAIRASEAQDVLDFLNSFGYANPTYTWTDLCPFTTQ
ncbi:MAG: hypothetical protein JXR84_08190 [Anaerolineae bacterium]|nr:hypothetical protein [Anaerolineae bacterium]